MTALRRPAPVFHHLDRLSDERGLFEHALLSEPRRDHGYCVDDVARGLVVLTRESAPSSTVLRLEQNYLSFVLGAISADGSCHNRMGIDGEWSDEAGVGDWWGRALWGLGVVAAHGRTEGARTRALAAFRLGAQQESPDSRAMSYAALGAAAILQMQPHDHAAERVARAAIACIGPASTNRDWPWPEPTLRYANATIAQALIVAGSALHDSVALNHGLVLIDFLLRVETRRGHLSVTPVGGRGRRDLGPAYDQQPIEVAAIADACNAAYHATHDPRWLSGVRLAWNWFLGSNDSAIAMFDEHTGGGYDGLEPGGRNLNQGAESTLAMLSTAQHARAISQLR